MFAMDSRSCERTVSGTSPLPKNSRYIRSSSAAYFRPPETVSTRREAGRWIRSRACRQSGGGPREASSPSP